MRRARVALFVLAFVACHGARTGVHSVPGQGAVTIEVVPNPIIAKHIRGTLWEFACDVTLRETGGRPINVQNVSATVFAGALQVGREEWDANRIHTMGYSTTVPANGAMRYHFAPQRDVPDERYIDVLKAEIRVEATDDTGAVTSASTVVTVRH
jgi:hypothetical protein